MPDSSLEPEQVCGLCNGVAAQEDSPVEGPFPSTTFRTFAVGAAEGNFFKYLERTQCSFSELAGATGHLVAGGSGSKERLADW